MNLLWAIGYPVTAIALHHGASASFLAAIRLAMAFFMLIPWLWRIKRWSWALLGFSACMGIIGFSVPLWLQIIGLHETNPAIAALSISAEPVFTFVLASMLLGSKLTGVQRGAIVLAVVGSWVLTGEPRPTHAIHVVGDGALFLALVFFAAFNIYSPRLFQWVNVGSGAALTFGFGALASTILWLIQGARLPHHADLSLIASLGFMAIGATGSAYLLWLYAIGRQSVSYATLFLFTQPLVGTLLSWLLGQSRITLSIVMGGILIITAMTLGHYGRRFEPRLDKSGESSEHGAP